MKGWYKIHVGQEIEEIKRVLNILFSYHYVFHHDRRIKDYNNLCAIYLPTVSQAEWEYIVIGNDSDCKMVMAGLPYWEYTSTKNDYKTISLEKFLVEMGDVKKEESKSKIITLEQFNEEFESYMGYEEDL